MHTVPVRRSAWHNIRAGVKGLLTGLPITIARDEMPEMAALLRRLVAETRFNVVHADQLSMAGWGLLAARGAGGAQRAATSGGGADAGACPGTLLDEHNAIYRLTERMAAEETKPLRRLVIAREARAFRRYEAAMLRAYDAILTVTDEDRDLLLGLGVRDQESGVRGQESEVRFQLPDTKFTVIPICVAPEAVQPVQRTIQIGNPQSAIGNPPTILHLGTMFWPPNVAGVLWFAREVLPRVHAEVPHARFVVVGKNPPAELRDLAADPRVEVTGYVADATPYLAAADVFVVPLSAGGGMRVKILDAWLWGLPVVSTPIGAEGIHLRDGENILIAGDGDAFAAAVVRCLTDPALNTRLRAAGRAWVERTYAWQTVYRRVDDVYARLPAPT